MELRLGRAADGDDVLLDASCLLDQTIVIGPGGVGKTSLARRLLADVDNIDCPALAVDTKGDLSRGLARDLDVPLLVGREQRNPSDGPVQLRSLDLAFIESLFLRAEGDTLSEEVLADELDDLVAALLGLAGFRPKKLTPEFSLVQAIVWHHWMQRRGVGLAELIELVERPPVDHIGAFSVDQVISAERRSDLAGALAGPLRSLPVDRDAPVPIDIGSLLYDGDATLTTVLSFTSGTSRVQKFLVAALLAKLKTYLAVADRPEQELSLLLYLDEATTLLPAGRKVLTTDPLVALLEVGASIGLGVVLVMEELSEVWADVEDLCQTWFVGAMPGARPRAEVVANLDLINPPVDEIQLNQDIRSLDPGNFILKSARLDSLEYFELD